MKIKIFLSSIMLLSTFSSYVASASETTDESLHIEMLVENEEETTKTTSPNTTSKPTIILESVEVSKKEVQPGDYVTISIEAISESPIENFTVSFKDLNNVGPNILLAFNPETNRYEGQVLLEDNLREGPIRISTINLNNENGTTKYTNEFYGYGGYELINLSEHAIQLTGSHGPYIDMESIQIDSITHPNKLTGLTFKVVNPQYIAPNGVGFDLITRFSGPIKVNTTHPDYYYNTLRLDEVGNATSYSHYLYENDEHIDGTYHLDYVTFNIYNSDKTEVEYSNTVDAGELSFEYLNKYSATPIFDIGSLAMNSTHLIDTDLLETTINGTEALGEDSLTYLEIEWVGEDTGEVITRYLSYDESLNQYKSFSGFLDDRTPDNYIVNQIKQYINGNTEFVYNSSIHDNSHTNLDDLILS